MMHNIMLAMAANEGRQSGLLLNLIHFIVAYSKTVVTLVPFVCNHADLTRTSYQVSSNQPLQEMMSRRRDLKQPLSLACQQHQPHRLQTNQIKSPHLVLSYGHRILEAI